MAYSSRGNFKPVVAKAKKGLIYVEDEIYCAKTENGFYLFHTTMDPAEKYKQKRITNLSEKPDQDYIVERMKYGMNNDKLKWLLNKEKCRDWIEENYEFVYSDESSPWAPKKLGEKRAATPATTNKNDSDTDDDSDPKPPASKVRVVSPPSYDYVELSKRLDEFFVILMEIRTHIRQSGSSTEPLDSVGGFAG